MYHKCRQSGVGDIGDFTIISFNWSTVRISAYRAVTLKTYFTGEYFFKIVNFLFTGTLLSGLALIWPKISNKDSGFPIFNISTNRGSRVRFKTVVTLVDCKTRPTFLLADCFESEMSANSRSVSLSALASFQY